MGFRSHPNPGWVLGCCLVLGFLFAAQPVSAQRCGDFVWINLRTEKGRVLKPGDFGSVTCKVVDGYTTGGKVTEAKPDFVEIPPGVKSFSMGTGCGMDLMEFTFVYRQETMIIRLRNLEHDGGNCFLNGLVFRKGTFEFDFQDRVRNHTEHDLTTPVPFPYSKESLWVLRLEKLKLVPNGPDKPKP